MNPARPRGHGAGETFRPVWCDVDLDAIRANAATLAAIAAPAQLLATVKAEAYGHGAVPVARAALAGGATWLGVAFVEEGIELRDAGITAPILLLSEPPAIAAPTVVAYGLTPFVYTSTGIEALGRAASAAGVAPFALHLKVDTGMHRVGCAPEATVALAREIEAHPALRLEGLGTHLAAADDVDAATTLEQLARFDEVRADLRRAGIEPPIVHVANSAGLLGHGGARFDLVRVGIALYGIAPAAELAGRAELRPALSLRAEVAHVQDLPAGARVSYGGRYTLAAASRVVTVPLGYADGVPRNFGLVGGEVLIRGMRCPVVGIVTMDQLLVDVGAAVVERGDEVVLMGRQGDDEITAIEWAERLDTIPYEVVARVGSRVRRRYRGDGAGES